VADQKRQRKIVLAALIFIIIIAAAAGKILFFRNHFLYAGTLEATKVDLSARISSVIGTEKVQEGDPVAENQELVLLSCEDVKVDSKLANLNYQRTFRLFQTSSVSQEAMDLARNRKEEIDVRLNWCAIRSPIRGTVLSRYHEPGEWVTPGTKLLTIANIQDIWAIVYVPQPEVSKLQAGMKMRGYLPELNNREFVGRIVKINDEAEFTPKNVQTRTERTRLVFGVKISFFGSNSEEILKPGMTIEMKLPGD
jgi:HlyD family secretion protein